MSKFVVTKAPLNITKHQLMGCRGADVYELPEPLIAYPTEEDAISEILGAFASGFPSTGRADNLDRVREGMRVERENGSVYVYFSEAIKRHYGREPERYGWDEPMVVITPRGLVDSKAHRIIAWDPRTIG